MDNESSVWKKDMLSVMSMPGVKVDRKWFLTRELSQYCSSKTIDEAIGGTTIGVISDSLIEKLANAVINNHTVKVTAISTAAGIPGGWWAAATIPADLAQYYYHTFVLAQKLAYIYGLPDICGEDGQLNEISSDMLTLFVGVMSGVAAANEAITNASKALAEQVIKRLPQKALTKTWYYPIIKNIAKWLGKSITKESFAKGVGKLIPIMGGVISGGVTLAAFRPSAKRLQKKLREQMPELKQAFETATEEKVKKGEYVDYEE